VASAWACSSSAPPAEAVADCKDVQVIVAASDYSSSMVCGAPPCEAGPRTSGVDLGKDPQLSTSNGRVFYLARDMDLVHELDPACGTPLTRFSVHQEGLRGIANAHDVAAANDGSLFVVLYNVPRILIMKDGKQDGVIELSTYDMDGNPQADAIQIVSVGGVEKAFVTLERLDDRDTRPGFFLRSNQPSMMLRIDVATRQVEAAIELAGRNPFNPIAEHAGGLYLAEPGNFNSDDDPLAGIERFDTATSTTRLLVAEKDLGGSVSEIAVTDGCGAAIVAGPTQDVNPTSLITFDPTTGRVLSTASAPLLGPTPGYDLQGLAFRNGSLYVGDRRSVGTGYGVHVFDRDPGTCNLHDSGRSIALPQKAVALRAALGR
jgi:hypothetical protein